MKSVSLVVLGQCYSKANSRIMTYSRGTPRVFKNPKVLDYVDNSITQLKKQLGSHRAFEGPIKIEIDLYYQSKRSDLDVSLIQDILEQKVDKVYKQVTFEGVYKNDRQIVELIARKHLDKDNPRVEVVVSELNKEAAI